jgi:hypothetical protein
MKSIYKIEEHEAFFIYLIIQARVRGILAARSCFS